MLRRCIFIIAHALDPDPYLDFKFEQILNVHDAIKDGASVVTRCKRLRFTHGQGGVVIWG